MGSGSSRMFFREESSCPSHPALHPRAGSTRAGGRLSGCPRAGRAARGSPVLRQHPPGQPRAGAAAGHPPAQHPRPRGALAADTSCVGRGDAVDLEGVRPPPAPSAPPGG